MTRSPTRALVAPVVLAVVLVLVAAPPARAQAAGLSLSDVVTALRQAPGWYQADLAYQSAADGLAAARAAAGLQISAGGSYSYADTLAGPSGRRGSSADLSVSASATVLPWAPAEASIANAELTLQAAALDRDAARAALVVTAEQQYFAARLAATARALAKQALDAAEARLRAAQAQHAQGALSADGLAQAEANAASAQAAAASAQANEDLARRALFATLGTPPTDAPLTTAPTPGTPPQGTLADLIAGALQHRDDVQVAAIKLRQAEQALAASQAQRWIPSASLSVGVTGSDSTGTAAGLGVNAALDLQRGVVSGSASYPVAPAPSGAVSTQVRIGASVSIPLDAPSADASIASGRTAVARAQAALAAAQRAAELEVRQRYAAWQAAKASLDADGTAQKAAEQALATAQARQAAGLATQLDVASAQVAAAQAQRTVEADQNALTIALLQLRNALGEPIASPGGQP